MTDTQIGCNLRPRLALLNWFVETGSDISEEIRDRLAVTLASSTFPAVLGSINSICITLIAYVRLGYSWLLLLVALDLLFVAMRIAATNWSRVRQFSSDLLVASGLGWAGVIAASTATIGFSDDTPMIIASVASALGSCAGIISRNYAAPRVALAQVIIIDAAFKISFGATNTQFIPLLACQGVGFILLASWIMRQQRQVTVMAISGEIEGRRQSRMDPLTGLLNRRGLAEKAEILKSDTRRRALFYLDLDGFKQINDRLGHGVGDETLRQVARRLSICLPNSLLCRMGGDEFILVVECDSRQEASATAARIIYTLSLPYMTNAGAVSAGVSIGIAMLQQDDFDLKRSMMYADEALYRAKRAGRGCALFYDDEAPEQESRQAMARSSA